MKKNHRRVSLLIPFLLMTCSCTAGSSFQSESVPDSTGASPTSETLASSSSLDSFFFEEEVGVDPSDFFAVQDSTSHQEESGPLTFSRLFCFSLESNPLIRVQTDERPSQNTDLIQHHVVDSTDANYLANVSVWVNTVTFTQPGGSDTIDGLYLVTLQTDNENREFVIGKNGIVFVDGFLYQADDLFPISALDDSYQYFEYQKETYTVLKDGKETSFSSDTLSDIHCFLTDVYVDEASLQDLPRIAFGSDILYLLNEKEFILNHCLYEIISEADFSFLLG